MWRDSFRSDFKSLCNHFPISYHFHLPLNTEGSVNTFEWSMKDREDKTWNLQYLPEQLSLPSPLEYLYFLPFCLYSWTLNPEGSFRFLSSQLQYFSLSYLSYPVLVTSCSKWDSSFPTREPMPLHWKLRLFNNWTLGKSPLRYFD